MTLFESTVTALNSAAFIYLASCIVFFISIARSQVEATKRWATWAGYLVVAGALAHTFGLAGRWVIGGVDRPPWTNLYESLIFFSWGAVMFQVFAHFRWRLPLLGAIIMPLIFLLMGMAVMTPNKEVEPLIPALQSNWLKIHVVFGMTAYAAFTGAACFAFLHLIKNKVPLNKVGSGLSLMILLNLGIAGGQEAFTTGQFFMARTVERQTEDGKTIRTKDVYREYEGGPVITRMEQVPLAEYPFWASFGLFLISAFVLFFRKSKTESLDPVSRNIFMASLVAMLGLFGTIIWAKQTNEHLSWASNPYLTMLLSMTFFMAVMFVVIHFRYSNFMASLPEARRLDELSYKSILFAFPFQTLLLITGAIWAYYSWGRSWGWDPKETWALITWFVYLIYLHGKLLMNWRPNFLSVVSLIGFMILVFAFLGVNLVLSGLHSYGSA